MFVNLVAKKRNISAKLTCQQIETISAFIKGAVYAFCNNNQDPDGNSLFFSVHNLFGKDNYYWVEPLIDIYKYYVNQGQERNVAVLSAGKDVGILLKNILLEDDRLYEKTKQQRRYNINTYRWIKQ